jgi:hypothetical protein
VVLGILLATEPATSVPGLSYKQIITLYAFTNASNDTQRPGHAALAHQQQQQQQSRTPARSPSSKQSWASQLDTLLPFYRVLL